jgi:hypothetical protein
MKRTHALKILPKQFDAVLDGRKRFEVRKNDRDFHVDDYLQLLEWLPDRKEWGKRAAVCAITYILPGGQFGIRRGWVVLGIELRSRL